MTLADLIKHHRAALGISQRTLAEHLGVTQSYITQLEGGSRKPKNHDFIIRLANALDVSTDTIYTCIERLPPDMETWTKAHIPTVRHLMEPTT